MNNHIKKSTILLAIIFGVSITLNKPAFGQQKKKPAPSDTLVKPVNSVTDHAVKIGGETIEYKAIAGTMPIYNNLGEPIASFGYTAYIKKGVDDVRERPILFAFNGGPGSASIWLHLGALGPRRIKLNDPETVPPAPYELVNNEYSPLNVADVVMIDPVGTGYSRAAGKKENSYFWGVDHDIESISRFIIEFIETHGRWNSPKYILGESYGSFRVTGIANHLFGQGIAVNGIIMVGTVLDLRTIAFGPNDNLPYVIYLPTYAATAWHYDKVANKTGTLEDFIEEVENFAINEYAPALLKGDNLPDAERTKIINKLAQYTGLSKEFIGRANLRVGASQFAKRILHDEMKIVGRYDSRYSSPAMDPLVNRTFYDPSSSDISPAFKTMFLQYYQQSLNFGKDRQYMFSARGLPGFKWKWGSSRGWPTSPNTAPYLARAMTTNPNLRVHVISGYFDLATPFMGNEYTLSQMNIPESVENNIDFTYLKAGHMSYIRLSALEKMHEALVDFIK